MEKNNIDIRFDNYDTAKLEGIRDFVTTELDENVLPYICDHDLMFVKQSHFYDEYLDILGEADSLVSSGSKISIDPEKVEEMNKKVNDLYKRTKALVVKIADEQKKSSGTDAKNDEDANDRPKVN